MFSAQRRLRERARKRRRSHATVPPSPCMIGDCPRLHGCARGGRWKGIAVPAACVCDNPGETTMPPLADPVQERHFNEHVRSTPRADHAGVSPIPLCAKGDLGDLYRETLRPPGLASPGGRSGERLVVLRSLHDPLSHQLDLGRRERSDARRIRRHAELLLVCCA